MTAREERLIEENAQIRFSKELPIMQRPTLKSEIEAKEAKEALDKTQA